MLKPQKEEAGKEGQIYHRLVIIKLLHSSLEVNQHQTAAGFRFR